MDAGWGAGQCEIPPPEFSERIEIEIKNLEKLKERKKITKYYSQ